MYACSKKRALEKVLGVFVKRSGGKSIRVIHKCKFITFQHCCKLIPVTYTPSTIL